MNTTTYNPETQTITVHTHWGDDYTYTYKEWYAKAFVFAHLHYNGGLKNVLTYDEQWQAYKLCDGFGETCLSLNLETGQATWQATDLDEIGWDWSHVRDSSPEALVRCAEWIAQQKWAAGSLDALVKDALATAEKYGLSALDVVPK